MKKFLLFFFISINSFGQIFYIEKVQAPISIDPGVEAAIHYAVSNRLISMNNDVKINDSKEGSTYTIKMVVERMYAPGRKAIGHIVFLSSKTDKELLRSATEKAMRNPLQGMKNPLELMFDRIATYQFPVLLRKLESIEIPDSNL